MNILALDLGTATGWALSRGPARVESGVQVFDVRRGESPGMRYLRFNRWLDEIGAGLGVDGLLIVYEAAHHRGGAATEVLNGMTTRVQEWVARNGFDGSINHQAVHSATLKKATTGSGRADKTAMRHAVHTRGWMQGREIYDDNEIDALALLHYALTELAVTARHEEKTNG